MIVGVKVWVQKCTDCGHHFFSGFFCSRWAEKPVPFLNKNCRCGQSRNIAIVLKLCELLLWFLLGRSSSVEKKKKIEKWRPTYFVKKKEQKLVLHKRKTSFFLNREQLFRDSQTGFPRTRRRVFQEHADQFFDDTQTSSLQTRELVCADPPTQDKTGFCLRSRLVVGRHND
jgi:hypothetical protein